MSLARSIARAPSESWARPGLRAALVLWLAAEVVAFTIHFESGDIPAGAAWSVGLIKNLGWVARPAIVAAIAATCLGAGAVGRLLAGAASRWNPWPFLAGHVAMMALFAGLSDALVAGLATSRYADLAVAAWLGSGAAALGLWLAALLPRPLWGPASRAMAGPLAWGAAAGLLAWGAGRSTAGLWDQFHRATFRAVAALLGIGFAGPICDPDQFVVGARGFAVTIAPACSGYEGIGLIWAFLGVYLILFRRELRFPAALLLLPIGTAVIWAANVVRIVALVAIGAAGHPGLAVGGFHSQSGWIAFNAVGLGLVMASRATGLLDRGRGAAGPAEGTNPVVPFVMPLVVLVGSAMITGALTSGAFDALYPARVVAVGAALWLLWRRPATFDLNGSWAAAAIGALVFALWMALEPAPAGGEGSGPIPTALRAMSPIAAALWLLARVVGSVVTVPIVEELAFRGFLLRRLASRDFESVTPGQFTWFSLIASSACFGALHGRWLAGTLAGIAYAMAYRRRGRLGDAVVAHAVTNALIAGLVLASGRWSLWT
ncbi:exosortase E/protease, VPEID-CTERM system [Tundrisphaera sp. TA3]|uniref:exosortase E/protease, VPEID-CTERM system n=1 Tax=Tundrisphaera sp. TA3 TaxID=3435775 RepID=UPI003EC0E9A8